MRITPKTILGKIKRFLRLGDNKLVENHQEEEPFAYMKIDIKIPTREEDPEVWNIYEETTPELFRTYWTFERWYKYLAYIKRSPQKDLQMKRAMDRRWAGVTEFIE